MKSWGDENLLPIDSPKTIQIDKICAEEREIISLTAGVDLVKNYMISLTSDLCQYIIKY